jgi:hypothetical protein
MCLATEQSVVLVLLKLPKVWRLTQLHSLLRGMLLFTMLVDVRSASSLGCCSSVLVRRWCFSSAYFLPRKEMSVVANVATPACPIE